MLSDRPGLQRIEVDGEPAYVLIELVGVADVGDRVIINTTAVDLGLGTGGWHVVHWIGTREGATSISRAQAGHIMKLRYTSLQTATGAAEEDGEVPDDLDGTPVVALALHSQLASGVAAAKVVNPELRLVYVMTDGAALPIALSDLVHELRQWRLLDATVTAGHAFGGTAEAVNVRSGLAVARHVLGADVIFVGMGPGSVGTSTTTGFSGLEVGATIDSINDANGHAIAALRVSDADRRPRHQGVSDHSRTVLRTAVHTPVAVPVPRGTSDLPDLGAHAVVVEEDVPDWEARLAKHGIEPTSMGRDAQADPRLFGFAAAAGAYAARRIAR